MEYRHVSREQDSQVAPKARVAHITAQHLGRETVMTTRLPIKVEKYRPFQRYHLLFAVI